MFGIKKSKRSRNIRRKEAGTEDPGTVGSNSSPSTQPAQDGAIQTNIQAETDNVSKGSQAVDQVGQLLIPTTNTVESLCATSPTDTTAILSQSEKHIPLEPALDSTATAKTPILSTPSAPPSRPKSTPLRTTPSVSMTLEELEEEEDLTFQLKKTPTQRAFTKRKDRTSKIQTKVESSSVENPNTPVSPRSQPIYNKDTLEELKRQQRPPRMDTFVADSTATSTSPLPAFPLSEPSNSGNLSLKELISEQVRQGRIPDPKLIQAARQEREKLRLTHEGDFIPLSSSTNHPGPTLHSLTLDDGQYDELDDFDLQILREDDRKARYIDEDEVVLSAEEDDLTFGSKARQLRDERELETRQRALEEAENEILDDNDDEIRHWEMEQIKKGGAEGAIKSFKHDRDTLVHKIHQAIKVTPIPTLTAFQSRIRQRLAKMEETQKANRYDQDQLNKQVQHAQDLLTKAFKERTVLEQRLAHYTKLLQESEKKGVADSAPVSPQSSTPRLT